MNTCEYCNKKLKSKYSLKKHQNTAKYCLEKQNKKLHTDFKCKACNTMFTQKINLQTHLVKCSKVIMKNEIDTLNESHSHEIDALNESHSHEIENLRRLLDQSNGELSKLRLEMSVIEKSHREDQDFIKSLLAGAINNDKDKIQKLSLKYQKRQKREQYDKENVIYIVTNPDIKEKRIYIVGKTKNLTKRLSTYNKSQEHQVVFHNSCGSEENMNIVEKLVHSKLDGCRIQANRERFLLPPEKDISYFINTVQQCITFTCS